MRKIIILILLVISGAAYGQLDSIKVSTPNSGLGDKIRVAFQKTNLAITQVNANTGNILLRLPISDTTLMLTKYLLKTTAGSLYANQMIYPASGIPLSSGSGWGTSITNNSANWNTAYGWGNHAGLYDATGTAAGVISTHQSTYNHSNYNTAYTDRLKWDGDSIGLTAATGRTSLGGTTIGQAFFTLANPSAITFPRINADNSVTALSAENFKTALSLSASDVGLGNVTNEDKATMFSSPTFTTSATLPATINLPYGAILNFNFGDVTLTHGQNVLTIGGGRLALGINNLTMTGTIASTTDRVTKGWFTDLELTNLPTVGNNTLKSALAITASDVGSVALPDSSSTLGKKYATGLMLATGLGLKVNVSDTATMLTHYINKADTSAMLNDYINKADTADMLDPYASRQNINDSLDVLKAEAEVGISLADTTGNAPGNYMTRENYLTYSSQSNMLKTLKNFGVGIKGWPVGFANAGSTYTLSENRIYVVLTYLNRGDVITGAKWYASVAGKFTADSIAAVNGVALYKCDAAGTTSTKVAESANNANIWRVQVTTVGSAAYSSQYTATEGYHYIAFMYNQTAETTAPKIYSDGGIHQVLINNLISDSKDIVGYVGTQATFPETIAASSITGLTNGIPFLVLY